MSFSELKDEINFCIVRVDLENYLKIYFFLNVKTPASRLLSHVCYSMNLEVGSHKDFRANKEGWMLGLKLLLLLYIRERFRNLREVIHHIAKTLLGIGL